jgi:hypothetical protein
MRCEEQQPGARCETRIAQNKQVAAIETVRHVAGDKKQKNSRQELAESDEA